MATWTGLRNEIADDLHRSDMTAAISAAMSNAISHYEKERWWFQEQRATSTTSASQAFMAVPSDFKISDNMLVTINGSKEPLKHVQYKEINETDSGRYTGQPTRWAYYQNQIRLYPVPDGAYVLTLSYIKDLSTLSASGSNAWTTDGKDLIRFRAEKELYAHRLKSPDNASLALSGERDAYGALSTLNDQKVSTGSIKKTDW